MRVLVVDDSPSLADIVAEGLTHEGIATDTAYDGCVAANKLAINHYDVVVLGRKLTGPTAAQFCQMISDTAQRPMVLMLSGVASPGERVNGLRCGADDYLAEPFDFAELVLRVRSLVRRQHQAQPRVLRAGDVELDCVARLARRGGRPLALSAKELALLEALMATSPGYLSAEQLLERVWDEHADPFTKTVTVTISRLRRKVGEPQMIETAIGVGYRVAAEVASDEAVLQEHDAAVVDELAQRRARRDRGPEAMTRDLLVLETARVKVLRDPA